MPGTMTFVGMDVHARSIHAAAIDVMSGTTLTYSIVVSNAGPSSAWQAALRDNLPFGTEFKSVSTTGGSCSGPAPGTKGGT